MADHHAGADRVTADAPEPEPINCPRCDGQHWLIACPFVKAIDFEDADVRLIRRVEFLTPADYGRAPAEPEPEKPYPSLRKA